MSRRRLSRDTSWQKVLQTNRVMGTGHANLLRTGCLMQKSSSVDRFLQPLLRSSVHPMLCLIETGRSTITDSVLKIVGICARIFLIDSVFCGIQTWSTQLAPHCSVNCARRSTTEGSLHSAPSSRKTSIAGWPFLCPTQYLARSNSPHVYDVVTPFSS